jgi:hypothetical protein
MITIKNLNKLGKLFKSKLTIVEADTHYLIRYYYPTLSNGDYYRITLSRFNPPQADHKHKDEYLMLCGECCYWLSKSELKDVDAVYEAIIDVAARHTVDIGNI